MSYKIDSGVAMAPHRHFMILHVSEDKMNKELAQEWETSAASQDSRAAAPKNNVVALKQIVTIRLDTDMLEWFKGAGPGYQTRINQILRQYMADHKDQAEAQVN